MSTLLTLKVLKLKTPPSAHPPPLQYLAVLRQEKDTTMYATNRRLTTQELQRKLKVLQSRLDRQKQQTDILRQQHKTPSVGAMATPPEASPHIGVKAQHMYMYMCSVVTYSLRVD